MRPAIMRFVERLKKIETKHPIGVYGVLATSIGILVTLWLTWPQEVAVEYTILSSANIIEMGEDTPDLHIQYAGQPITGRLKVITLRIENTGDTTIRETDYTEGSPLGIRAVGGTIIERPNVIAASSPALARAVRTEVSDQSIARFGKILLNPKDYIVIKLLVISPQTEIELVPMGRIAGVGSIPLHEAYESKRPSVVLSVMRCAGYVIGGLFLILVGLWIRDPLLRILFFLEYRDHCRKLYVAFRNTVVEFRKETGGELRSADTWLIEEGGRFGSAWPNIMLSALRDEDKAISLIQEATTGGTGIESMIDDNPGLVGLRGIMRGLARGLTMGEIKETLDAFVKFQDAQSEETTTEEPSSPQ